MKKIIALVFIALFQTLIFLALFRIIPLDDSAYAHSFHYGSSKRTLMLMIDSFLELKILAQASSPSKPSYEAWVYLDELQKKNDIQFELYDNKGDIFTAPGSAKAVNQARDKRISRVIQSGSDLFEYRDGKIFYATVLENSGKCMICHDDNEQGILGAASISYADNSVSPPGFLINIVLIMISMVNTIAAVFVMMHDPFARVKELFDKK